MGRHKNALREHYIAPFVDRETLPEEADYMYLAKYISDITDATDEETDDTGFYDGDGTVETTVTGVSIGYTFSGFFDPTDPAQAFIAAMRRLTGSGRRVWHKIISSDGSTIWEGWATVTDITAGAGAATDDEEFECTITFNQIPTETVAI